MKTIKRVSPGSVAKLFAVLYGTLGLIFGLVFGVFMAIVPSLSGAPRSLWYLLIGPGAAILYALMGLVLGYVFGLLYNLAARFVGGIRFEIEEEDIIHTENENVSK